jgi:carbon storage regulator
MLVLSRRTDESVKIGNDIEVMVVEIEGNRVRLGFTAPPALKIWRTELCTDAAALNKIPSVHFNGDEPVD